jgi:hypothetical protein
MGLFDVTILSRIMILHWPISLKITAILAAESPLPVLRFRVSRACVPVTLISRDVHLSYSE